MKITNRLGAVCFALCCTASASIAKTPDNTVTPEQRATFQTQAVSLEKNLLSDLAAAEADARQKNLSSADITAAIQAALQNTITRSGADPRVVLAALSAAQSCPKSDTGYQSDTVTLGCDLTNSKPLSAEAQTALASLQQIVVALIDNNPAPGAIGSTGTAPLGTPPTGVGGGGTSDYRG